MSSAVMVTGESLWMRPMGQIDSTSWNYFRESTTLSKITTSDAAKNDGTETYEDRSLQAQSPATP